MTTCLDIPVLVNLANRMLKINSFLIAQVLKNKMYNVYVL